MQLSSGRPMRDRSGSADAVKRVLTTAGITGAALTLSAAAALPVFASGHEGGNGDGHNPPGNNGTVKIHETAGDSSPHNQPHVSCSFYVSFFGFDRDQPLNISFTGQAPTGKDTPITISDPSKRSHTSATDAGGAGNDYDGDTGAFDATNLDLSALGAPAKQGYHIKLDVATGEPGGHKYKVFWFSPCTSTPGGPTGGTTGGSTGGTTGDTTENGGTPPAVGGSTETSTPTSGTTKPAAGETTTGGAAGGATVLGETLTRGTTTNGTTTSGTTTSGTTTSAKPSGAQVLGESFSRGSSAGLSSLPFTGAEVGVMSALGLAAVGGGAALTVAGRRRRRVGQQA